MKFYLLEIEPLTLLAFYLVGLAIGVAIFYYIIKEAVKNGIIEANAKIERKTHTIVSQNRSMMPAPAMTPAQSEIYHKYERGEISFEEYQKEFNVLGEILKSV